MGQGKPVGDANQSSQQRGAGIDAQTRIYLAHPDLERRHQKQEYACPFRLLDSNECVV